MRVVVQVPVVEAQAQLLQIPKAPGLATVGSKSAPVWLSHPCANPYIVAAIPCARTTAAAHDIGPQFCRVSYHLLSATLLGFAKASSGRRHRHNKRWHCKPWTASQQGGHETCRLQSPTSLMASRAGRPCSITGTVMTGPGIASVANVASASSYTWGAQAQVPRTIESPCSQHISQRSIVDPRCVNIASVGRTPHPLPEHLNTASRTGCPYCGRVSKR